MPIEATFHIQVGTHCNSPGRNVQILCLFTYVQVSLALRNIVQRHSVLYHVRVSNKAMSARIAPNMNIIELLR